MKEIVIVKTAFNHKDKKATATEIKSESSTFAEDDSDYKYFTAKCSDCGREFGVPFKPTEDRPVLCSTCFAKLKK